MTATPTFRGVRHSLISTPSDLVLSLLAPSVRCTRSAPVARFSTSPALWKRDNNKNRGLSAIRHTGPRRRQTLSVKQKDYANQQLPTPVERTSTVYGDPDHGLWEFFTGKKLLRTPQEESRHGVCTILGRAAWKTNH